MNRFQISQEYGFSVGRLDTSPFVSFTLKSRNIFRWLEVFENVFRYSFEAQYTMPPSLSPIRHGNFPLILRSPFLNYCFQQLREWAKNYNPKVSCIPEQFCETSGIQARIIKAGLLTVLVQYIFYFFILQSILATSIQKVDPAYTLSWTICKQQWK